MTHDPRFDELAMAYLTGDISPADLVDLELRLKADASARARLAELSEQEMALRQIFLQHENHLQLPPDSAVTATVTDTRRAKAGAMRGRRSRVMRAQRGRDRSSPFWVPLTLAASLLLFLLLFFMHRPPAEQRQMARGTDDPQPPAPVPGPGPETKKREGTPERGKPVGSVVYVAAQGGGRSMSVCRVEGDREQRLPLVEGMPLLAGDRIETGPREPDVAERRPVRAAVSFSAGATLDLADETNVEAISEDEVRVASGLLYAATGSELSATALTVRTPHADVRSERVAMDVSVASGGTAVAVEDGSASLRNAEGGVDVAAVRKSIARPNRAPTLPVAIYAASMWRGRKGPAAPVPVGNELAVVSFTLIDADRDEPIAGFDPLPEGTVVLNLAELPTRNLNIRANTVPDDGISVRFDFDNKFKHKLEQFAPYAFNGDRLNDYDPWTPSVGSHVITATPFADPNGRGKQGKALRITLQIVDR